jgi:hypothetical protein
MEEEYVEINKVMAEGVVRVVLALGGKEMWSNLTIVSVVGRRELSTYGSSHRTSSGSKL